MPISNSAKKSARQDEKQRRHNLGYTRQVRSAVKEVRKLAADGKMQEAAALLPKTFKLLDKAAKMNALKKGTASRKKSRLAKAVAPKK